MPTTSPSNVINGPPLLPLLIAASVCIKSNKLPFSVVILLSNPLMIPNVTVGPPFNASALPIVIAQSPGCKASELPNEAAF